MSTCNGEQKNAMFLKGTSKNIGGAKIEETLSGAENKIDIKVELI